MDREQTQQLGLFGWIVTIFLVYPTALGWLSWKLILRLNAPKGLLIVGIAVGLFLATFHLLIRTRREQGKSDDNAQK